MFTHCSTKRLQEVFRSVLMKILMFLAVLQNIRRQKKAHCNGVRQTLIRLSGMQDSVEVGKKKTKPIAIIAYVEELNIPSKNLLEECGFISWEYYMTTRKRTRKSECSICSELNLFPMGKRALAYQPDEKAVITTCSTVCLRQECLALHSINTGTINGFLPMTSSIVATTVDLFRISFGQVLILTNNRRGCFYNLVDHFIRLLHKHKSATSHKNVTSI